MLLMNNIRWAPALTGLFEILKEILGTGHDFWQPVQYVIRTYVNGSTCIVAHETGTRKAAALFVVDTDQVLCSVI